MMREQVLLEEEGGGNLPSGTKVSMIIQLTQSFVDVQRSKQERNYRNQ